MGGDPVAEAYTRKCLRSPCPCCGCHCWGVLLWVAVFAAATPFAGKFLQNTTITFDPPKNSKAQRGYDLLETYFPNKTGTSSSFLLVELNAPRGPDAITDLRQQVPIEGGPVVVDGINLTHWGLYNFTSALYLQLYKDWCGIPPLELDEAVKRGEVPQCGAVDENGEVAGFVQGCTGYYTLEGIDVQAAELMLAQPGNDSSLLVFEVRAPDGDDDDRVKDFNKWLRRMAQEPMHLGPDGNEGGYADFLTHHLVDAEAQFLSVPDAISDVLDEVLRNLLIVDGIAIPLSIVLITVVLRNARLMFPAVLCFVWVIIISFGVMGMLTESVLNKKVHSMSVVLLMSLDCVVSLIYSLLLLNRFREGILEGMTAPTAVEHMLATGGQAVAVSSLALCGFCLAITFVEEDFVHSVGLSCLSCALSSALVSLSFIPCVLLACPGFFAGVKEPSAFLAWPPLSAERAEAAPFAAQLKGGPSAAALEPERLTARVSVTHFLEAQRASLSSIAPGQQVGPDASVAPDYAAGLSESLWFRYASATQRPRCAAALVALAACAALPFAVCAFLYLQPVEGFDYYLPKGNYVTTAFERIGRDYGWGFLYNYKLVIADKAGGNLCTEHNWQRANAMVSAMDAEVRGFSQDAVQSPFRFFDREYGFANMSISLGFPFPDLPVSLPIPLVCTMWIADENQTWPPEQFMGVPVKPVSDPFPPLPADCLNQIVAFQSFQRADISLELLPQMELTIAAPAMFVLIQLQGVNPMDKDGERVLRDMRAVVSRHAAAHGWDAELQGAGANAWDGVNAVYDALPWVGGVVAGCTVFVVGLGFCSAAVPFRVAASIALTYGFAMGWTTLVYDKGALNWMNWDGVSTLRGTYYATPVVVLPLTAFCVLAFDLFITSGALDFYHNMGLSARDANIAAFISHGWVVCAAGCICALAFGALVFSKLPLLNQVGWGVCWAALFDALIVCMTVTPGVAGLLGRRLWWPREGRERKTYEEIRKDQGCSPFQSVAGSAAAGLAQPAAIADHELPSVWSGRPGAEKSSSSALRTETPV
eukprot:TRINITY_DN7055_c0_g1_i1.p1 TRINITY_DN7055_c0_g1~~TRINITY_DN7055_c0_g1_i1.p1  ORF type:complete len:1044 (+),score=298.33 TRINITY_DN7055_c0_g1_i1:110-3241(+)